MDPPTGARPGATSAAGETPSRYEVLARIASGGMANVHVGRVRGAVGFSRLVAIKRPHPFVSEEPTLRDSFVVEARVAAAIHHPNVVSVLDVEVRGEEVSLILDYVEGCSLSELLAHARRSGKPVPTRVAVRIVLDAASGLHAAHVLCSADGRSLGIVHRDVSPHNILVGVDGHARLTDFGIAKITVDSERTTSGVLKGKLGYMPPEYVDRKAFDARSDEYALAVVAWEALTGVRLFSAGGNVEILRRMMTERPAPPSSVRAELSPLDDIFAQALGRQPSERFDSVLAFSDALEERARRLGWVGSHDEVGRAVLDAAGERLRERRSAIESSSGPPTSIPSMNVSLPSPRDEMSTLSLRGAVPDASPASQSGTVSLPTPPPSGPLRVQPRWALVAAVAAPVLGVTLAVLVARPGKGSRAPDVGAHDAPNGAASLEPSSPPASPSIYGVQTAGSGASSASVVTTAAPAESLPRANPSPSAPSRRGQSRGRPIPAQQPPAPPATSNQVLFTNPG